MEIKTDLNDKQELMSFTKYDIIRFNSYKYQAWSSVGAIIITLGCLIYAMWYKRTRSFSNFFLFLSVIAFEYESAHWGFLELKENFDWTFMYVQVGVGMQSFGLIAHWLLTSIYMKAASDIDILLDDQIRKRSEEALKTLKRREVFFAIMNLVMTILSLPGELCLIFYF